jgi:hypothetical protein
MDQRIQHPATSVHGGRGSRIITKKPKVGVVCWCALRMRTMSDGTSRTPVSSINEQNMRLVRDDLFVVDLKTCWKTASNAIAVLCFADRGCCGQVDFAL